ncbi:MAG: PAS domain S-box protein, partial [Methanobacterium sp.]
MHDANILIVEDESITALGIKHKLERLGYSVAAVESSGEGAIKKTRELKPDIILMDIVLKGEMDGIEAAHEINHSFNIPIVYLTAYSDNSILERAKLTRPSGYITKPFSDADLKSAIEIALYNHPSNVFDPANEELKKNDLSEASADETEFHSKILNDLKEIEEKYRTLFNKSPENVIILGADGKLMDLNEAALKNTGKKREDLIGKHFSELELLPDKDMPLHLEKLKQVLKDGANESYEARFIDKDGQIQYIELYTNPLKIDDEIFAIQIISHDFTELKKANEALKESLASKSKILNALKESLAVKSKILDEFKESEEKYRQLVENAQEGICSSDLEGTITFVNPRMAEMFGYTTSTMQGKSIFSFIKENQIEKVQKYLKSPNDTLKGHFDFEFIKKDGKKIFTSIETSIIRDEDGNKKGILALVADISRGKKAENRLKENEEYLKTIFATVQTGIIVIDSKSKEIIDVNKAASNLIGLSRDEIIGKVCHRFICPHEEGDCPITDLNQRVDNSQRVLLTANNEEIPI